MLFVGCCCILSVSGINHIYHSIFMKELRIIHEKNFYRDFFYYQSRFPTTHTLLKSVHATLLCESNAQCGTFGIQVSSEWEDKCYTFKPVSSTPNEITYEYLGICKS